MLALYIALGMILGGVGLAVIYGLYERVAFRSEMNREMRKATEGARRDAFRPRRP